MPVAKSLLALLMAGLLAFLGYFFMFRDDSNRAVSGAEADRFMQGSRNTPRNNDDPNYAEELRQNAALVENTQKMAATLGKDISGINSQLAENQRKYESEMNKLNTQLANMQTALEQAKQGNTEAVSAEAQKLAEAQNKAYQESIANLNQAIQNSKTKKTGVSWKHATTPWKIAWSSCSNRLKQMTQRLVATGVVLSWGKWLFPA